MMKIAFFGSAHFAVFSLEALAEAGYDISCVVTQPDRKKGRGLGLAATEVKAAAARHSIELFQPERVNDPGSVAFLRSLNAELFVVVAYGQILSSALLAVPKICCVNLHASLLPKYRGAAPMQWAIIKGERQTGLTVIKMAPAMDAGPVILSEAVSIDDLDTSLTLEDKLSGAGAQLLRKALDRIGQGAVTFTPQDETKASFAPKLKKQDGHVNWSASAREIHNLVRACLGWPVAFTGLQGRPLKLYKTSPGGELGSGGKAAGEIIRISHAGISVACGQGVLVIEELQAAGGRRMGAKEFVAGHALSVGAVFE